MLYLLSCDDNEMYPFNECKLSHLEVMYKSMRHSHVWSNSCRDFGSSTSVKISVSEVVHV